MAIKLTETTLARIMGCPIAKASIYTTPIIYTLEHYGIETKEQVAMFLAQTGHETLGLRYVKEIWGPTPQQLRYEDRKDLGNVVEGDGKKYLGRGLIQVTGRANYRKMAESLDIDCEDSPEILEKPLYACLAAGEYWKWHKLKAVSDIEKATRKINGGLNGFSDRYRRYTLALANL